MEWISVKKHIPAINQDVLVMSQPDGKMYSAYYSFQYGEGEGNFYDNRWSYLIPEVSHWTPLPETIIEDSNDKKDDDSPQQSQ